MARKISVEILGDSTSLEKAFARSAKSAQQFQSQVSGSSGITNTLSKQASAIQGITKAEEDLIKVRSRRASSLGPFRFAGVGLAAGLGLFAATQAARELSSRLEQTGEAAFTTEGRLKNMAAALTTGNLIGAFESLTRVPKTLEEIGASATMGTTRLNALKQVAKGETSAFLNVEQAAKKTSAELEHMNDVTQQAGTSDRDLAQAALDLAPTLAIAANAMGALTDYTARLEQQFYTATGAITTFKGAADDVGGMRGPGARDYETPYKRPGLPTTGPFSPSQRRELALIGKQGAARLPGLQDRLDQLKNMLEVSRNAKKRLTIATNIANAETEIASVMADIAAARKAAAEAAAAAAEAARQQRIATATGWLEFAVERAEATKPISDDLKAWRAIEKYYQERIRQEGRKLELVRELWRAQDRIKNLRKGGDRDPLAGLMQVSTKALTGLLAAGTGLGAGGRRTLGANISAAQIQTFVNVSLDGQQVAKSVTVNQKRGGNRTGQQTSGRR